MRLFRKAPSIGEFDRLVDQAASDPAFTFPHLRELAEVVPGRPGMKPGDKAHDARRLPSGIAGLRAVIRRSKSGPSA